MSLTLEQAKKTEDKTKQLSLVKTCDEKEPTCVVSTSTLEVLLGSTFNYLDIANLEGPAGSPMLITTAVKDEGTANGVCHFDSATKSGHCEFTGGTGTLAGFHANLAGVALGGNDYSLAGPYWFAQGDEKDAASHK